MISVLKTAVMLPLGNWYRKSLHVFGVANSLPSIMLDLNSFFCLMIKVLGYYQSKGCLRKSSSKAFKLDLEAVRPDPAIPLEEYRYIHYFP